MIAERQLRMFTPEEYLTLERAAEYKSEYMDGQIYAMSGGSPDHSTITINVTGEIHRQLKGRHCRAYSNDMKVRTGTQSLFSYPDLVVVCNEPRFHDIQRDVMLNPTLIVEVLSPSTEAFDRRRKFVQYQDIASLQTYVLIAQNEPRIEQYNRQDNATWPCSVVTGRENSIYLASIDCTLALADVYDRIQFTTEPESA